MKWVEVPFPQMEPALVRKHIDAFVAVEPFVTVPSKVNKRTRVLGYPLGGIAPRLLIASYFSSEAWIDKNVEVVQAFIGALYRGIDTVTAMTVVSELHDFRRFRSPRELMSYLGLVPSEDSSGEGKRRGSITKAGNSHVRRVLIETAWHYRHPPRVGVALRKRREGQPERVIALADKAAQRLYRRSCRLSARGKPVCKVVTAVARELVGFIWGTLYPKAEEVA